MTLRYRDWLHLYLPILFKPHDSELDCILDPQPAIAISPVQPPSPIRQSITPTEDDMHPLLPPAKQDAATSSPNYPSTENFLWTVKENKPVKKVLSKKMLAWLTNFHKFAKLAEMNRIPEN